MKKILTILGILVLTTGMAYAEEEVTAPVQETVAPQTQQVDLKSRDKNYYRGNYKNINFSDKKNKLRASKEKQKTDKIKPNINDKRFSKDFKPQKPKSDLFSRKHDRFGYHKPHRPHHDIRRSHNQGIKKTHRRNSNNMRKPQHRRV